MAGRATVIFSFLAATVGILGILFFALVVSGLLALGSFIALAVAIFFFAGWLASRSLRTK